MRRSSIVAGLAWAVSLLAPSGADGAAENLVFASDRDGTYDIWRMNPDGTGQAKVGGSATADDRAPAVSPDGRKIAFVRGTEIWVMSIFGTNQTKLADFATDPVWSPDGTKIAFGMDNSDIRPNGIWTMNADGTGEALIVNTFERDHYGPTWSPDGQKIAFWVNSYSGSNNTIYAVDADGSNLTHLTDGADTLEDTYPDWSPDGSSIVFSRFPWCSGCSPAIFRMNTDGTGEAEVTSDDGLWGDSRPSWSSDGSKIAFARRNCCNPVNDDIYTMNPDGNGKTPLTTNTASDIDPDWGLLYGTGYPRPKGGTPLRASLVVAYEPCGSPNRQHAPPLAVGSCNPPAQTSDYLTVGTLDANGAAARSVGNVRFDVYECPPCANPLPEDVLIKAATTDVRNQGDESDYAGELQAAAMLQITDRYNGPGLNEAATTQPFDFRFSVPCTTNGDPAIGSTCSISTSALSLMPGAIQQQGRANWEVDQVRLYDGGADKTGSTTADNTLFEIQGVFVP